ncbi:hypothetical protein BX666DRAFT_1946651 [Dichotomocladium elegans]|nr:hypothetical protein BX666DRAFT_1946651 [Dichotomocladium elegans]
MESFFGWREIQETWTTQYASQGELAKKALCAFFDPNRLFSRGATITLYKALNTSTGVFQVVISEETCGHLHSMLADLMQRIDSRLPLPEMPVPLAVYKDAVAFEVQEKRKFQNLFKSVKKLNAQRERLLNAKKSWRMARELTQSGQHVLCSIDIEAWEQDHSVLLEIGWTLYDSKTNRYKDQHYLINSYRHLRNGRYVDDMKLRFCFGTSVWCTLDQALAELKKDLDWCVQRDGGFVLVGHGMDSDLMYLKKAKFMWPGPPGQQDVLDIQQSAIVATLNTDIIYGASIDNLHNPPSLGRTLTLLDIDHWYLHNAGNDAHYTMVLLMALVAKLNETND